MLVCSAFKTVYDHITYAIRANQLSDWSIPRPAFIEHKRIISEESGAYSLTIFYFLFVYLFERSIFIPVKAHAEFVCFVLSSL